MPKKNAPDENPQIARLIDAVEEVAEQLQVLREVIDEIREEFQWAVRNNRLRCPPMHITSMPKDPLAPDFGTRVNRYTPENLSEVFNAPPPDSEETKEGGQKELF